jgi:hypothetical protein
MDIGSRLAGAVLALASLGGASALAQTPSDPPFLYGIHDPGGAYLMGANKGWIVFTVKVWDPPPNFKQWSDQGYGVIVRLNHGYGAEGTLPRQADYPSFAQRAASYVQASPGVHYWIVANEPNLAREWPGGETAGEPITVARYADAYNRVWSAVKAVAPAARLAPAPSGTYGPPHPGAGIPGYVDYWAQVLNTIPAARIDALIAHTYTHGCDPGLITSTRKFDDDPYRAYYFNFFAYRDYMAVVPASLASRPVLITETDQNVECASGGFAWENANRGWVRSAYAEINNWNLTHTQKIRALVLFRWDAATEGSLTYSIQNRQGVMDDFVQAVGFGYRWTGGGTTPCLPGVAADRWRGEYFPNVSLTGPATLVSDDGAGSLAMGFGDGGPNRCGIGVDNFSARWTRSASFAGGTHQFTVTSDDGFRLYVDNVLRLDRWIDQAPTTYNVNVALAAGSHNVRLDWYERAGGATAQLSWTLVGGGGGNGAQVLPAESDVPATLAPFETRAVRVRVRNTGGTTWRAASLHRLGTQPGNGVTWSGFQCGGYASSTADSRAYLCGDVAPSGTVDFRFNVTAPAGGATALSVRMVQDGLEWIGAGHVWNITGGGSANPYPNCPCRADIDNYCHHAPSTTGCPMTFRGGYCDPSGNGVFDDADWVRGYYEFQDHCR